VCQSGAEIPAAVKRIQREIKKDFERMKVEKQELEQSTHA